MLDRFTVAARKAVASAVEEAHAYGAEKVGAEHLLLALCSTDGQVGASLRELGVVPDRVRERLATNAPPVPPPEGPREPLGPDELAELTRRLRHQGMPRERIRGLVERIQRERVGVLELGERAKHVIEVALLDATDGHADTVHLLDALLAEPTEAVEAVLGACGVAASDLRAAVVERLRPSE